MLYNFIKILVQDDPPFSPVNGRAGYFQKCWGSMRPGMGCYMWAIIGLLVIALLILIMMLYKKNNSN